MIIEWTFRNIIMGSALSLVVISLTVIIVMMIKSRRNKSLTDEASMEEKLLEEDMLKVQLKDLENQRKDIEAGLKKEEKVVSIKHQAAKNALTARQEAELDVAPSDPELDSKIKPYDAIRTNKSRFTMRFWKDHFKERLHPETTALVNMELMNGFHKLFIVKEKDEGFKYRGKKYLFDNEAKYYIIDSKLWCYDYHENFTLPIKRKIPLTAIKKSLEASNISEVEYATNPSTLERFTISKIAEGIMKGQAIDEFMKQIRLLLIIAMVSSLIHLVLFMFKSGMLQQIKIPGVTG